MRANTWANTEAGRAMAMASLEREITEAKRLGLHSLPAKPFDFKSVVEAEEREARIKGTLEEMGIVPQRLPRLK